MSVCLSVCLSVSYVCVGLRPNSSIFFLFLTFSETTRLSNFFDMNRTCWDAMIEAEKRFKKSAAINGVPLTVGGDPKKVTIFEIAHGTSNFLKKWIIVENFSTGDRFWWGWLGMK